jgi:hypothetical protein
MDCRPGLAGTADATPGPVTEVWMQVRDVFDVDRRELVGLRLQDAAIAWVRTSSPQSVGGPRAGDTGGGSSDSPLCMKQHGRELSIDPRTERSTDPEANRLFTRDYRKGFELPRM